MAAANELVFRSRILRSGTVLGPVVALAIIGGAMAFHGSGWPWVYLGLAALLSGFVLWEFLAPGMRLRLSATGFAYGTLIRRFSYRWDEVAGFSVTPGATGPVVAFLMAAGHAHDPRVRAAVEKFDMFDRVLPDTYGMKAAELAALLEEWRNWFAAVPDPHPAPEERKDANAPSDEPASPALE